MDSIQKKLLEEVAGLHEVPQGAYSLRINGSLQGKNSSENIEIVQKTDKPGIDIYIKPGTKNESLHIPVILSQSGLRELVYNDFHVGEDCDVTIVAGCGIHNGGSEASEHSGVHSFFVGKNATLVVHEKIMTHGKQVADTEFEVELNGENSGTHVVSRAVARDSSKQKFLSKITGNNKCSGHTECDAIIMDDATVAAIPEILAVNPDASLIHEAAIGKIAGEQLIKLMTLGLSEKEAEEEIVNGFLR